MQITKQINDKECGVCVINTLVFEYYNKDIKQKLLAEAVIGDKGMSLFDFETLATKHGIACDSFQIERMEFEELPNNKLFVVLVSDNTGALHYTIIKKHTKHVEMFDSISGKTVSETDKFLDVFSGTIVFVSKLYKKINVKIENDKIVNIFNWKYFFVNIFLQGLNIAFSVVGANYLSKVITFGNEFKNVITISALFLIFFACASFSKYILSMITKTDLNNNFLILANKFLEVAFKKDGSFFKKVNKTHIYMNDTAIRSICEFYIVEVPKLVSSAVLCFICLLLISILKYEFLLFCLVISLVITIIGIIEFALQKRIIKKVMKNEVENIGVEYELANYVGTKQNYVIRDEISKKIKSNWHNHIKYDNTNSFYRNNIELVLTTIEKVISIAIVIFGYYFISNKEMDFAKLLFLFTLSNMYWNAFSSWIDFAKFYIHFNIFKELFLQQILIGNQTGGKIEIDGIVKSLEYFDEQNKKVSFKKSNINNIELETLNKLKNRTEKTFFINSIPFEDLTVEWVNSNVVIFDKTQVFDVSSLIPNFFSHNLIVEFIKKFKYGELENTGENSIENQQILSLFVGLTMTNKVIVFDDCFRYISKNKMEFIKQKIIPAICKNNIVIQYCPARKTNSSRKIKKENNIPLVSNKINCFAKLSDFQ